MIHPRDPPSANGQLALSVAPAVEIYLQHSAHGAKETHVNRVHVLKRFCEVYGKMRLADCKPFHLKIWIDAQKQLESQWSRKRWCATIQACFNWLSKLGVIGQNPFHGVYEPGGKRGRPITDHEFRSMLRAASDGLFRRYILFLYFVGCRPGEAANARWSDLKLERGKLVLDRHKTDRFGDPRVLYLHPVVVKMLAWIRRNAYHKEFIFVNRWQRPWGRSAICQRLRVIREKTGISNDAVMYCYRHGFGTTAILSGIDIATVAQLMGHRRIETTRIYVHLAGEDAHLHAAIKQVFKGKKR